MRITAGAALIVALVAGDASAQSYEQLKAWCLGGGAPRTNDQRIQGCDAVIKAEPSAAAYHSRGFAHSRNGFDEWAIRDYSEALKLDPRDANILFNRANSHRRRGDYANAVADYTAALAIDPAHFGSLHNRGEAHFDKREYQRAIADYDAALKVANDPRTLNSRGLARLELREFDQAIADFDRALVLNPDYANARTNRELAVRRKGQ